MVDLAHLIGDDLVFTSFGDAVMVREVEETQERVLRRLLSNPNSYLMHLDYGAGLASFLGQTVVKARIKGIIQRQMLLEQGVRQMPPPVVDVVVGTDGNVTATIKYVDTSGNTSLLTVPIEGF